MITNLGPQIRDIPDLVGEIVLGVVFALISRPPSLPDVAFAKPNFVRHQSTPIYCDNSNARAVLGATYAKYAKFGIHEFGGPSANSTLHARI